MTVVLWIVLSVVAFLSVLLLGKDPGAGAEQQSEWLIFRSVAGPPKDEAQREEWRKIERKLFGRELECSEIPPFTQSGPSRTDSDFRTGEQDGTKTD